MTSPSSPVDSIAKAPLGLHHTEISRLGASFEAGQHPAWVRVEQDGNGVHGGFYTCAAATGISPAYIRADIAADLARQAEAMKREMAELRRIGDGMSNILHHWKQQSMIRESDRKLMAKLQEQWDAIPRALIGGGNAKD